MRVRNVLLALIGCGCLAVSAPANPLYDRCGPARSRSAGERESDRRRQPRQRATAPLKCGWYWFCLFVDSNYRGPKVQFTHCGRYDLARYYFWNPGDPRRHSFDHNVSSVINSQNTTGRLEMGSGQVVTFAPFTAKAYLGEYNDGATIAHPC